jgi:hypothetical protein
MQLARFVRTLMLFLVLGLAGQAGGCGASALNPADQEKVEEIGKKERAGRHQELKAVHKNQADAEKNQATARKGAHRGAAGR